MRQHKTAKKNLYSGDLNTGLVWYSNNQKLSDRRMVLSMNTIWILDQYPNGGLNTELIFEYWTCKSLLFRCFFYSSIQMFIIQIPTVFTVMNNFFYILSNLFHRSQLTQKVSLWSLNLQTTKPPTLSIRWQSHKAFYICNLKYTQPATYNLFVPTKT